MRERHVDCVDFLGHFFGLVEPVQLEEDFGNLGHVRDREPDLPEETLDVVGHFLAPE